MIKDFEDFYLKIKLVDTNAKMPTRATIGDAGCDVYSPIDFSIEPGKDILIDLGWQFEMPEGFVILFQNKSGVCTKKKCIIGASTVDANYRGHVHVHLFNLSNEIQKFEKGDKLSQFVVYPIWDGNPYRVFEINENTQRSNCGFGSTGVK